jgi:thioredoxin 1
MDSQIEHIIELVETNFDQEVLKATIPVVVDFYAPWCGPCKLIAPLLEQFAGEFAGRIKFAKANVDETPELAANFESNTTGSALFAKKRAATAYLLFYFTLLYTASLIFAHHERRNITFCSAFQSNMRKYF